MRALSLLLWPILLGAQPDLALRYFQRGQYTLARQESDAALHSAAPSAQAHYLAGRFALEADQNPQSAIKHFEHALEMDPASFKAHYYLGICYQTLGQPAAARKQFLEASENTTYSWPFRSLAELELQRNAPREALPFVLKAIEREPQSAENQLLAGKVYQALGDPVRATSYYRQAVTIDPFWETPHFLLGKLLTRSEAAKEFQRFEELKPGAGRVKPVPLARSAAELASFDEIEAATDPLDVVRRGERFLDRNPDSAFRERVLELEFAAFKKRNDYTAARRIGAALLALDSRNAPVLADLALLIASQNDAPAFPEAESYAARALAESASLSRPAAMDRAEFDRWRRNLHATAHAARGLLALRLGDADAALLALRLAIGRRPAPEGSDYLRLGEALLLKKDPPAAHEAFTRAVSLGPQPVAEAAQLHLDPRAWIALRFQAAREAEQHNDFTLAASEYQRIIEKDPSIAEVYHNLGLARYRLRDYPHAAESLRQALRLKPELAGSQLFLGLTEFRLGHFNASAAQLRTVLRKDERNREAWLFLLRDEAALGRLPLDAARQALGLFPMDAELHFTVAQAGLERLREIARQTKHRREMDAAQAALPPDLVTLTALVRQCYETVLQQAPDSRYAHLASGQMHESKNEVEPALAEYRQAGDHFLAARLLAQNARLEEAETEFLAALAADPQNDRARADLAQLYLQLDKPAEAGVILRQLLQRYPADAYGWADLGKVQDRGGQYEEAIRSLKTALQLDPTLHRLHYQLATLYRKTHRSLEATRELAAFEAARKERP